jgi:beta-mannosidase
MEISPNSSDSENEIIVQSSMVDIYRQERLSNLPPDQTKPWVVNVSVDYLGTISSEAFLQVQLYDKEAPIFLSTRLSIVAVAVNGTAGRITGDMVVTTDVKLWWPVGYGDQVLYNLSIQIIDGMQILETVKKRVGFRTIVLDQTPISDAEISQGIAPGNKWNFEINGHEIYCKGSNFVPPDGFWTRVTEERIKELFISVVDSVSLPIPLKRLSSLTRYRIRTC